MANPYRGQQVFMEHGVTKLPNRDYPITDRHGEINASSKADMAVQTRDIINAITNGRLPSYSYEDRKSIAERRRQRIAMQASVNEPGKAELLGEALTADILETTNREGFARRLMEYREIPTGQINEIVFKHKQVRAWDAVSATQCVPVELREKRLFPTEFHINAHILIDTKEMSRASSDLLEEKYEEALEQIMVVEDRMWRFQCEKAAEVRNTVTGFPVFTPRVFSEMMNQVARWGIPVGACVFESSLWRDLISGSEFGQAYDPVTKWEILQTGYLGSLYGVSLISDTFRQDLLRVIKTGEVFMVGAPTYHGVLTTRENPTIDPVNMSVVGIAKRGWFFDQITSINVMNSMSVARGVRI